MRPDSSVRGLPFALVMAVLLVVSPVTAQEPLQRSASPADIAANLHHPDAAIRAAAIEQFTEIGFELAPGPRALTERLTSRDPLVRLTLATELHLLKELSERDILLRLTLHDDQRIRLLATEACAEFRGDPLMEERVLQLATLDSDPIVNGQAKLILADWGTDPSMPHRRPNLAESPQSTAAMRIPPTAPEQVIEPVSYSNIGPTTERDVIIATEGIATAEFWSEPNNDDLQRPVQFAVVDDNEYSPAPVPLFSENRDQAPTNRDSGPSVDGATTPDNDFGPLRPDVLDRPLLEPEDVFPDPSFEAPDDFLLAYPVLAPLGYTGPSGVLPTDYQQDGHFVPMEDRWRSGFPEWDRYGKDHPPVDDYPYVEGHWWDPFNQNVLKGDYPVIGQHTFFKLEAEALMIHEYRQLPTPTTPFESTVDPFQEEFFGDPNQYFTSNFLIMSFELFHGSAAFKPFDWLVRVTPVFNINYLSVQELGIVNPDVRKGTSRQDDFMALQEWFAEAKLADLSPDYDFVSARVGSQPFTSDFRGFIFDDINRAVRLFGTRLANRDQFNIIFFDQTEKDTNSQLNTFFDDRNQNTFIANYYRQDFVFPGYTAQASFHYNIDGPDFQFDNNDFLARPDPAGSFKEHEVEVAYLGFAGEGHIGKMNIANAFYWALGEDSANPISGQQQDINAQMFALELSVDRDWVRFRSSVFYASGDQDPFDTDAEGFDSIFDNPNFAGGEFSFWQRQEIRLFGVGLVQRNSLVPDLRSSKFQGQSNFVNPGLILLNLGMDFEVTPKLKLITNANYLEFDETAVLEAFTFQDNIDETIGVDISIGAEYRPLLSDNIVIEAGYAALIPGRGFKDLYGKTVPFTTANADNIDADTLHAAFMQMILVY